MDHYYIILEHSHPIEYGKLKHTTYPLRIQNLDYEYLVVKRMFNAHEFYISSMYGQIHHILKKNNLLTEKSISELRIRRLLEKISSPFCDEVRLTRNQTYCTYSFQRLTSG